MPGNIVVTPVLWHAAFLLGTYAFLTQCGYWEASLEQVNMFCNAERGVALPKSDVMRRCVVAVYVCVCVCVCVCVEHLLRRFFDSVSYVAARLRPLRGSSVTWFVEYMVILLRGFFLSGFYAVRFTWFEVPSFKLFESHRHERAAIKRGSQRGSLPQPTTKQ